VLTGADHCSKLWSWLSEVRAVSPSAASFVAYDEYRMQTAKLLRMDITFVEGVIHVVRIPRGYVFDGASIPRWAWSIVGYPFEPDLIQAACVHDWYCEQSTSYFDRTIGDSVFLKLLSDAGVSSWRRCIMFGAVRLNTLFHRRRIAA